MKNEEGTYKQGKFLSNKLKPEGLRVDPVRGSARGAKGGPGEGERPRGIFFIFSWSFGAEMMNRRWYSPVVPWIIIPDSRAKCFPVFRSKRHKNPTVQGGTYLLLRWGVAPSLGRYKRASLGLNYLQKPWTKILLVLNAGSLEKRKCKEPRTRSPKTTSKLI